VSLIVAGTVRVPPGNLEGLRRLVATMAAAGQTEDGRFDDNYAADVTEPGLIHLFEHWRDQAALDKAPNMACRRAAWPSFGVSERRLFAYEVAAERAL
jgi:quinol monooxygenase YgiN